MSAGAAAFGPPLGTAMLRLAPEDFRVRERQWVRPSGAGEHWLVCARKRGITTPEAARRLAMHFAVSARAVSYAGLKDRHALVEQWFSVHAPGGGKPPPLSAESLRTLAIERHHRKLRRGTLGGNDFRLRLHAVDAPVDGVARRLAAILARGVPNAFGKQRFGRDGSNVRRAEAWFRGEYRPRSRHEAGILLSAVRSELFNRILARRVADGTWDQALPGDVMMLDRSASLFRADSEPGDSLARRVECMSIHPTGALFGNRGMWPAGESAALEEAILAAAPTLTAGLEQRGVEAARRALRVPVGELSWWWPQAGRIEVAFSLPPGAYATTVLTQCFTLVQPEERIA